MTLPSRRKHPTTAPSIHSRPNPLNRRLRRGLAAGFALLGAWCGNPARADDIPQRITIQAARPLSSPVSTPLASSDSPGPGIRLQWKARKPAAGEVNELRDGESAVRTVAHEEDAGVQLGAPRVIPTGDVRSAAGVPTPAAQRSAPRLAQRGEGSILVPPGSAAGKGAAAADDAEPPANPIRSKAPAAPFSDGSDPGDLAPAKKAAPGLDDADLSPPKKDIMPDEPGNQPKKKTLDGDERPGLDPAPLPKPNGLKAPPKQPSDEPPSDQKGAAGRDCGAEKDACRKSWNGLNGRRIGEVSLDVAPVYRGGEGARSPKTSEHVFRSRGGQVIAQGMLVGITNGRVVVKDAAGRRAIWFNELSDDDLCFVTGALELPHECSLADTGYAGRSWCDITMTWKASSLCHKPLYFEEVELERYGHDAGPVLQPILSGAHFFVNVAVLPYKAGINPPRECQYALGYYRPGDCAPWLVPPIPLSCRGALAECGLVGLAIGVLP